MGAVKTHTAAYTSRTHPGPASTCAESPCAPRREALAILREDDPRTPAEQAAIEAVEARRWVPLHADDYATGVVLLLSRAGLLRDQADERRAAQTGAAAERVRERVRAADRCAISAFAELTEMAAGRLEDGADPTEVAAQLRNLARRINERREHQSSTAAQAARSRGEASV